jgi:hypothetical protein
MHRPEIQQRHAMPLALEHFALDCYPDQGHGLRDPSINMYRTREGRGTVDVVGCYRRNGPEIKRVGLTVALALKACQNLRGPEEDLWGNWEGNARRSITAVGWL